MKLSKQSLTKAVEETEYWLKEAKDLLDVCEGQDNPIGCLAQTKVIGRLREDLRQLKYWLGGKQ